MTGGKRHIRTLSRASIQAEIQEPGTSTESRALAISKRSFQISEYDNVFPMELVANQVKAYDANAQFFKL